ncbi:MAG: hypothetical protein KHF84_09895, partial [Thermoplasmata archaeon]|nr:hypothetical protein [Candidatus Sysuiplasma jiujiangense]
RTRYLEEEGSEMLNRLIFHVKKIKRARMKISMISLTFIPMATSSLGTTIFNSIWGLLMGFLQTIMNGLGTMFGGIFSGFTQSIDIMFQGFGFSLSGYGVYGPMMFVFGIGIALLLGFLIFAVIGPLKDLVGMEDDL